MLEAPERRVHDLQGPLDLATVRRWGVVLPRSRTQDLASELHALPGPFGPVCLVRDRRVTFTRRTGWFDVPTPIGDRLEQMTGGERLATWNRHRGHVAMDGKRKPGGEWDTLRSTPIRRRRRLTSAGYLALGGMQPDDFADLLVRNGAPSHDPIAWYLAEADRALKERRHAATVRRRALLARSAGHQSYYDYRQERARALGYRSLWHYRKEQGWQ